MVLQLEFFKSFDVIKQEDEIRKVKESCEKVRKKLFAENNKLRKELDEVKSRLDILEKNICSGEIVCEWKMEPLLMRNYG